MILEISTLVGVLDGVEPLPRVRSMIASTRLRRAMRSSSSFFSRSSISLRNLKINKVVAMIKKNKKKKNKKQKTKKKNSWSESASKLYRPSDRHLSAK
jgi:hypothetical protein